MWIKEKFFKYSVGILLVLLIIFLIGKLDFVFNPIKNLIAVIFFPILVSGFLYYLLRPIVGIAEKKLRMPRTLAILVVFLLVVGILTLVGIYSGSLISKQMDQLLADSDVIINSAKQKAEQLLLDESLASVFTGKIQEQVTQTLQKIVPMITNGILGAFYAIAGITTTLVMVPFILFYLLRDDKIFSSKLEGLIPKKYRSEVVKILDETDNTLSVYIIGQGIIAVVLGVLMYIGYLLIGIEYPIILAFFVMITAFIPLFGAIIGVVPAVLVGLAYSPIMAVEVVILAIVIQQLEGNLISPNLVGKRLAIHPLTLIILFLIAASLYGFIGMLIVVPTYAIGKVIVQNAARIYRLKKTSKA